MDRHRKTRSFAELANLRESELAPLLASLRHYAELTESVRALAGQAERAHIVGALVDADKLTVLVDSQVWATRMRFQLDRHLSELLKKHQCKRVNVRLTQAPTSRMARPHSAKITESTAKTLKQAAESTPDPALKSIYLRLASRSK